ncbi:MAG: response regulator [Rhodocyclaceae bacterium]|nr:response regulator [Rhodocyclaceae bacterium]
MNTLLQRLRALLILLPGSDAFRRAGIRAKLTVMFYATTFFAIAAIGLYGYWNASTAYRERAIQLLEASRDEVAANISEFTTVQRSDLGFVNNFYAILRFAYWKDLGDKAKMEEWRTVAGDTLRNFAENYRYYYKIRFIGRDGQEDIHVQTDHATGKARLVADKELQNNAGRDYVTEGLKLKRGEIYVSALDLNTEHGQVEKPHVPVLRFSQPVIGGNNVVYGVTVTNVRAEAIYDFIRKANKNEQGRRFYLIDAKGNFLFHPDTDKEFGNLLGHGYNFDREHHNLLPEFQGKPEGVITRGGHIHVFRAIYPNPQQRDRYWFLVGVVDESTALADLNQFIAVFLALLTLLLAIVFSSTRYIVGQLMTPLQFVTLQLERLGRGETRPETLDYPAHDEIHQMLAFTQRVVVNMDALARQADAIAGGDLSGQVAPLSEHDRLGNALNNMTRQLADNHLADGRRNWLKDGLAELAREMTGDMGPQHLAEVAVAQVGRYLEAGRGVLYVWNEGQDALDLLGSYMYTERNALGARVKPGEGAVGQVAREMKPIVLHTAGEHDDLPPITTGTLSVPPRYTYTWPLQRDGKLHGVLEIATSEALDEARTAYLNAAVEIIASFLHAVLQRQRIKELLAVAEEAARQAQEQSHRLQEANTLMEEQQQQLQQQTEELQQTNSQMEEQQQQLQQQAEELQQANAQMEEQQQQLQQQTDELEVRNRELEQASRYKSDFLANMSHELRTPLNSIILLAKMLAMNDSGHLDEEEMKRASVIHHAGGDLLTLINDILDLSKIEAGKMDVHPEVIASAGLLTDIRRQFEDTALAKGVEFRTEDGWQGAFTSDRDKLNQIIRNLLSNAFKFTRDGHVSLSLQPSGDAAMPVCLKVSDTGIGIPEDKLQIIFDAFQQVDGSISRQFGGTGLGLSISLRLAQLLGGTIRVTSKLGEGSVFSVLLPESLAIGHSVPTMGFSADATNRAPPSAPSALAASPPPDATPLADDRDALQNGDAVILVIDDDRVFDESIRQINQKQGYKTLLATSGRDGLALAQSHRPCGILLDLGLPDMDGMEVLKELKGNRSLHNIPVYVVSGRDRDPKLLQQGIVGYLRKPVDDRQIMAAEAEVLAHVARPCLVVLESPSLSAAQVRELVSDEGVEVHAAHDVGAVADLYARLPCKLALVGLESLADTERCTALCHDLHQRLPALPILVYSQEAVSSEAEAALRGYTDSIIVQSAHARKRVLENIERFVREVRDGANRLDAGRSSKQKDRLAGRHILVVDDDARNLFVVTSALEQQGAKVENALNGQKALELLKGQTVDLVLMDVMMPGMSGLEATAAIKGDPALKSVPVVVLTAKALKNDRQEAFAAGADDYLAKPVDYDVLINMAAVWCAKKRS